MLLSGNAFIDVATEILYMQHGSGFMSLSGAQSFVVAGRFLENL